MTTPTPTIPSLASVINSQGASAGGSVTVPAPGSDPGQIVGQSGSQAGAVSQPQSASVGQPQAAPQQAPAQQAPAQADQPLNIRQTLIQNGYTVPESMSDADVVEALLQNLGEYYDLKSTPEITEYQKHRDEFQKYLQSQQQSQQTQPPVQTQAQPQKSTPSPAGEYTPEQLLQAVSMGAVTRGADGKWVAANPAYAQIAQAMVAQEEKAAQLRVSMAADPQAFIQKAIQEATEQLKKQFEESQKPILQQFEQMRLAQEKQVVSQWVEQNRQRLFFSENELTPLGKLYQKLEADIHSSEPRHRSSRATPKGSSVRRDSESVWSADVSANCSPATGRRSASAGAGAAGSATIVSSAGFGTSRQQWRKPNR